MAAGHTEALAHESAIIKSSPYLSLSLLVLLWNLLSTIIGVILNKPDLSTAMELSLAKYTLYGLSLVFFIIICVVCLILKYAMCHYKIHTKQTVWKDLAYDVIFTVMATLYLVGDNLPVFVCSTASTFTVDKVACRDASSTIVGISLILHLALYLVGILKLSSAPTSIIPVTGRIRKAYENALQLGKFAILIDQTFTTVVKSFTHVDLEVDEIGKCGCDRNTTAEVEHCLIILDVEVGILFSFLMIVVLVLTIWVPCKKVKSEDDKCCACSWENCGIFTFYFLVFTFTVIYTLADNRWLWTCVILDKDISFGIRIFLLSASFMFTLSMGLVYLYIYFPGAKDLKRTWSIQENYTEQVQMASIQVKERAPTPQPPEPSQTSSTPTEQTEDTAQTEGPHGPV